MKINTEALNVVLGLGSLAVAAYTRSAMPLLAGCAIGGTYAVVNGARCVRTIAKLIHNKYTEVKANKEVRNCQNANTRFVTETRHTAIELHPEKKGNITCFPTELKDNLETVSGRGRELNQDLFGAKKIVANIVGSREDIFAAFKQNAKALGWNLCQATPILGVFLSGRQVYKTGF